MVLLMRVALVAAALGVWIYAVVDIIRSDGERVQYLHKMIWLMIVLLFPVAAIAWLVVGRPVSVSSRFRHPSRAPTPPDDSPEFLAQLDKEVKRRRRADELRRAHDLDENLDENKVDEEITRLEEEFDDGDEAAG